MHTTLHLPRISEDENNPAGEKNGTWDETKRHTRLVSDLSLDAVLVDSFFHESASLEELHLVQRLFPLPRNAAPQVVVFCGVGPRDGAEFVCARVAETLAGQVKDTVCLMDANLKEPSMHHRYDLDGAACILHREDAGREKANNRKTHNLWVLPASALRERGPDFTQEEMREQLSALRERFGFLLICAPALESAPDGFLLGQLSDGIVLVLQAGSTHRATALQVRRHLENYGVRLLGAVLSKQTRSKR